MSTDIRLNLTLIFFCPPTVILGCFFQVCLCTSFPIRRSAICRVTDVPPVANMVATVAPEHFSNLQLLLKVIIKKYRNYILLE